MIQLKLYIIALSSVSVYSSSSIRSQLLPGRPVQRCNYTSSSDNLHDCFPNTVLLR